MKKLSETYKELGIAFTFPIRIKDANGKVTYYENSSGFCAVIECDANENETYYEDSDGVKQGTPKSENEPEELCAFCDKPDVFLKGLCPICFDDHYGD